MKCISLSFVGMAVGFQVSDMVPLRRFGQPPQTTSFQPLIVEDHGQARFAAAPMMASAHEMMPGDEMRHVAHVRIPDHVRMPATPHDLLEAQHEMHEPAE